MATTKWALDPAHSEVLFKVKHLMITNVTGLFKSFGGEVETEDEDFSKAKISFWADVSSISTGSADRDGHLQSPDFFDAANHPKITFDGTSLAKNADGDYTLTGNLNMHGVSKPVQLAVEYSGVAKDPWGNSKAGFTITGKINRKDWGLIWNVATEAGGVLVSEEIRINCEIQLLKQA